MGDSIGLSRTILSVAVLAVMVFLVTTVIGKLQPHAESQTAGTSFAKGTAWLNTGVEYFALSGLLIVLFGSVAYAVYTNQVRTP
jgi:hypothetical protein